jgi:hypothetical protein
MIAFLKGFNPVHKYPAERIWLLGWWDRRRSRPGIQLQFAALFTRKN